MNEAILEHDDLVELISSKAPGLIFANDNGAYLCTRKADDQVIKYFNGMHPDDKDCWQNVGSVFGNSDFGMTELEDLRKTIAKQLASAAENGLCLRLVVKAKGDNVTFDCVGVKRKAA